MTPLLDVHRDPGATPTFPDDLVVHLLAERRSPHAANTADPAVFFAVPCGHAGGSFDVAGRDVLPARTPLTTGPLPLHSSQK
ncbi:hypothetical protein [Dactylosporangium sp. NPDC005555]|uniref:hypothetical protein n=1 Tax=Dactylosporangium sp. NPDC005555 TaxID=3154889 RepID=UPI0033B75D18